MATSQDKCHFPEFQDPGNFDQQASGTEQKEKKEIPFCEPVIIPIL